MTREELRELLGEPTDTSIPTRKQKKSMIWKYGKVEYHFDKDDRVCLIYTEDEDHHPLDSERIHPDNQI